jgi:hypothetical protein
MSIVSSEFFTFKIEKAILNETTLTLFAPKLSKLEKVAYFRAMVNKYWFRTAMSMQYATDKEPSSTDATPIDDAATEMMVFQSLNEMGELYADFLKRFMSFIGSKDICAIGDYSGKDASTARWMTEDYAKVFMSPDEIEDLAIKYCARFFVSKKFKQS